MQLKLNLIPYKSDPTFLDEINGSNNIGDSIHIERMDDGAYHFRLNEHFFTIVASKDEVRIYDLGESPSEEFMEQMKKDIAKWKEKRRKANFIRNRKKRRK